MECVQTLTGHSGCVWNVSWSPDGDTLASCGEDKSIRLWKKENDSPLKFGLKTILSDGHTRAIRSLCWSPCGTYLCAASFDSTVSVWDKTGGTFECTVTLEGHENEVKSVAWSNDGKLLATCSRDKTVWIWDVMEDNEFECAAVLTAHTQDVKKVCWHPRKNILASASYDDTIKLFEMDVDGEWSVLEVLKSHTSTVWSVAFDKDGKRLASCSDDCSVKIWQQVAFGKNPSWKCVCTLSGYHGRPIYDISWCHLTDLIATAGGDDMIRVFKEDINSTESEPSFVQIVSLGNAHSQDVNSVMWNPVLRGILASASDDGTVKIWKWCGE